MKQITDWNQKPVPLIHKIIETKLREGTSELSKGQRAAQEHVINGNKLFEVRSDNDVLDLYKKQTIRVDEYEIKYKYKNNE